MSISLTSRFAIGSTSLSVPPLGLGTAHLGGMFTRPGGVEARETMQAAWEGGVRYFDTAPFYGRGLSEHRAGGFLMDQPRSQYVITTKIGRVFHRPSDPEALDRAPWPGGLKFAFEFDYSYDGVMRSYEQSLMRTGLETIDALLIHDPDRAAHGEHWEARMKDMSRSGIKALEELKRCGDIKAIGMGLNHTDSLETIPPMVDLDFLIVAMPYTLLEQSALGRGMKRCEEKNISVIVGAPFASGILVTGPGPRARYAYALANGAIQKKAGAIQTICQAHGVSLAAAALQFPLAHPAVTAVVPGAARPQEVRDNLAAFAERIPADLWAELKHEHLIAGDAPTPG